jgi:hypothetical protein
MKKATVVLISALLVGLSVGAARAEVCYKLNPFPDVLRLSELNDLGATGDSHILVYGNWIAHGAYTLPVVGALELNNGSTSTRRLGIHGTNNTASFGSNPSCVLDGFPGGAWFLNCEGAGSDPAFTNSGSPLTSISCAGLQPSSPTSAGPPAGGSGR